MIGQTLGHYRILEKIGAGGMGEVYRAHDTQLGRAVAIKVLPAAFAANPERLARFEQEARLLAALNHPNVAAIYGLEEANGVRFLVLELVEGPTLAERLGEGPLPLEEALTICRQIAEALEAAHERGIIHRDLKPGNAKVTPAGKVKVLDFGLAKAFGGDATATDLSKSPTASYGSSVPGVILGTAAYMSPEQARGKPLDKRTDIWSFGCVLYEILTGKQAFAGETVSDTIAKILEREPDWSVLPGNLPVQVREVLRRCLQKDANRRLHDIADAGLELEEALAAPAGAVFATGAAAVGAAAPAWRGWLPWGITALAVLVATVALWNARTVRPQGATAVKRFVILPPAMESLALGQRPAVALSPDGNHLVYVVGRAGRQQLYLRSLDRLEALPISGTEGASGPFFSPDGNWIGFFTANKLKKVPLVGGGPLDICDNPPVSRGASWGEDDTIVFTPTRREGLYRVPAAGGTPQRVTRIEPEKGELGHRWPDLLPGGKAVVFTIQQGSSFEEARIAVERLNTGERKILITGGTHARYLPTGHLIYARASILLAVPFDAERLEITGNPVPIVEGVAMEAEEGAAHYSLSRDGSLVYVPGGPRRREETVWWVNRRGIARPLLEAPRAYDEPSLSPDGRRLALTVRGANDDIWLYEIARDTFTRFTSEGSNEFTSVWTPDGQRVTFSMAQPGAGRRPNIFWKPADGSGLAEQLTPGEHAEFPSSWSPDGKVLAFTQTHPPTGEDIWILRLEGDRKAQPFRQTPFDEWGAVFSPDGRWLTYTSNETGQFEVYVEPFPGPGGRMQISREGGYGPKWARNGRELFYRNGDKLMAVSVTLHPKFTAGKPRLLFSGNYLAGDLPDETHYDVAPDGQHFVMIKSEQESGPTQLYMVLNWLEELKRRVPVGKK